MDFSAALRVLKNGSPIRRAGWNGKGMFLFIMPAHLDPIREGMPLSVRVPALKPHQMTWGPYIVMKTADENLVPWLAPQTDILAEDWELH